MRVELLRPDAAPENRPATGDGGFAKALDDLGAVLNAATEAENAFSAGSGSLQEAVYERARADVALSVATAAAQRAAQALQSVTNMQI